MSRLSSTLQMTCPRCREGKMFISPLKISRPLAMKKTCDVCGQKFEPEPGFYYGAMFISYVMIGFFSLGLVGLMVFYFKFSVEVSFAVLLTVLALIFLWNLRLSRSIWIHMMIKFDPNAASRLQKSH